MSKACIGIDLAAKTCVGAVRNERGELVYLCEFPTGEKGLVALVESVEGEATVLLEGCDLAYRARRVILPHAERVEAADPRRDSRIHGDPIKNDEIDAEKLSEIAFLGSYHPVHHTPDEEVYALHLAVKAYDKLTKKTAVQKNRIKAELRSQGIIGEGSRIYGVRGRAEALSRVENPAVREIIAGRLRYPGSPLKAEGPGQMPLSIHGL